MATNPREQPSKSKRLGGRGTFKRVLDQNIRAWEGPIGMSIAQNPNTASSRLGISIGRPVGNAVKRNRIKRLLREVFRASPQRWPGTLDVVILVKPHETMSLNEYDVILEKLSIRVLRKLMAMKEVT